ncbi:MAG: DUF1330 domain-containing protein [Rhodospirillales bacterium]|nr:DUF1330 domain-containing protein [Rhodospirillales bacterium]
MHKDVQPDLSKIVHGDGAGDPQVGTLYPTDKQVAAFAQGDPNTPVQMLNLLKYRDRAHYTQPVDSPDCSGREAYERYIAAAGKSIQDAGATMLWYGTVGGLLIGTAGDDWDDALIVQYPDRNHLLRMFGDPDYQATTFHREAALERTIILACTPHPMMG